ncbi:MAG: photosynthetic complex assembly protein PuhC [Aestuariivita sp.]|nr:photosynthetic complex assembly protein PuhC [Aestuariivita sp.]MCY4203951.1 photosynthetic complex assembly protein PuhC [Aestuariivita sp.]MCY4290110.1 photosynthetic complex assembly protein PuhC [Aestuariivita sp.]MCY4346486.1 photosynthetic complex assembly protein PuhC [Aestuariivita sp.]
MSHSQNRERELIPRAMLMALFGLVATCLLLVTWARITDRPLEATPSDGAVILERTIFLSGTDVGAARVLDTHGTVIADLSGDEGGFVAGVQRVIERERSKHDVPLEAAVQLQLREGNRLSIYDPSTEFSAELMGFGATNLRTFAALLEPAEIGERK